MFDPSSEEEDNYGAAKPVVKSTAIKKPNILDPSDEEDDDFVP